MLRHPRGYVEESRAVWETLVALLRKALAEPATQEECTPEGRPRLGRGSEKFRSVSSDREER